MVFEGADGTLSNVAAVEIHRDELEGAVPVFDNGAAAFGTVLISEDLEVHTVSFGLEASHDVVVGCKAVTIVARLECRDKYGVII